MSLRSSREDRLKSLEQDNERLARSVRELSMLNDLAREIGGSLDTNEVMRRIVRQALKGLEAEEGVITLVKDREDDPVQTYMRTVGSSVRSQAHPISENLVGWMYRYQRPLVMNDPANDIRFRGTKWDDDLRSLVCVPLMVRSRLTGILTVFNKKSSGGFSEDDQRLLAIVAAQSAQVIENARLHEQNQALAAMREELRLARKIQESLLPTVLPEVESYALVGKSLPAKSVGGDYYDFIPISGGKTGLCVADVSGKGLPAAMVMSNVQATLRGQALWADEAGKCLDHANKLLCKSIEMGSFVTLFYGMLDSKAHVLQYANAGHNPPLVVSKEGKIAEFSVGNLMLGFMPDHQYREDRYVFEPGDTLWVFTDGITEAMDSERIEFGEDRLKAILADNYHLDVDGVLEVLLNEIDSYVGDAPQQDDITVIGVRRLI